MAKKEKGYKSALENLIEDKGLDSAIVIEALTEALAKSYKKNYCGTESIVDCRIDGDGQIRIFITHHVVDDMNILLKKHRKLILSIRLEMKLLKKRIFLNLVV